jgi:hypothetical protein
MKYGEVESSLMVLYLYHIHVIAEIFSHIKRDLAKTKRGIEE